MHFLPGLHPAADYRWCAARCSVNHCSLIHPRWAAFTVTATLRRSTLTSAAMVIQAPIMTSIWAQSKQMADALNYCDSFAPQRLCRYAHAKILFLTFSNQPGKGPWVYHARIQLAPRMTLREKGDRGLSASRSKQHIHRRSALSG